MTQYKTTIINQKDKNGPMLLFGIWTFFLFCRPQDYITFLEKFRPGLVLGLLTMGIYVLGKNEIKAMLNEDQFRLYRNLVVVMAIGIPFSYYPSASFKDLFKYTCIFTMLYFLFFQIVTTTERLRALLLAYSCGVTLYALQVLLFGHLKQERIYFGTMFDANDMAYMIISFFCFNFLFLSAENKNWKKLIALTNITISLIVILKTGSRGGLLATITVIGYLMWVKTNSIKLSLLTKGLFLFLGVVSLQYVNINSKRYVTMLDMNADYNVTAEEGRIAIWKTGIKLMLLNPLTGVGMNRFNEGIGRDREERGLDSVKWQAPHNCLVQIGAETGIFGLFIFCIMSLKVFKITRQIIENSNSLELIKISEMARAGFIGHCLSAMFLSQAYSVYWAFYIVLSAVLMYFFKQEHKISHNNNMNAVLLTAK